MRPLTLTMILPTVAAAPSFAQDAGYRYSRIAADAALGSTPLNMNAVTFGFGYRF
jgi:hypothetical protein